MSTFGQIIRSAIAALYGAGNQFKDVVGTSQATVSRVCNNKAAIPDGQERAWYAALKRELDKSGVSWELFTEYNQAAMAACSTRSKANTDHLTTRARRAEAALLSLCKVVEKGGFKIPESVRQTVEAIRKERAL